jgi:hypothetical protein
MKTAAVLMTLVLVACSPGTSDSFDVRIADGAAMTATLKLCGEEVALVRKGDHFTGTRRTRCEGGGEIVVAFSDRPPVSCNVGYVTPGAAQDFSYVVQGGACG